MARPFIHINFAADDASGQPQATPSSISCNTDWRRVHILREQYDAIAVGAHTWKIDCPRLTARVERLGREPVRQPSKVIFAGTQACEVRDRATPVFVVGSNVRDVSGVTVLSSRGHDLHEPLASLYEHGVRSMLVEGGPILLQSFFSQCLADLVTIFVRAHSEEAAQRTAHRVLCGVPASLKAMRFGEGFLLASGEFAANGNAPRAMAACAKLTCT